MSLKQEWPTYLLLILCYSTWLGSLFAYEYVGLWSLIPTVFMVTLHSSLQHEMLHGHPTRSERFNELLVYPAIGLLIPYRRFRDLHLAHHISQHLTDPYDDPESWYLSQRQWVDCGVIMRALLRANATLLGRVVIGPMLSMYGFLRSELSLLFKRQSDVAMAWFCHLLGVLMVLLILQIANVPVVVYLIAVAYPGMSVLMIRTFIEHKASHQIEERTAVVESGWCMSLLFLNNNLHAVHHRFPQAPWFALPGLWQSMNTMLLRNNGHYHYPDGYWDVARRYLLSAREPVLHPLASSVSESKDR